MYISYVNSKLLYPKIYISNIIYSISCLIEDEI